MKIVEQIQNLRDELSAMRPLPPSLLATLREPIDLELTYSSNAIEGNTLTLRETAEVISHGITIGGKPLGDHLEAIDHHHALAWMYEMAKQDHTLTAFEMRQLHQLVLQRSKPDLAGHYAVAQRGITGSPVVFPSPSEVPHLMEDFAGWLKDAPLNPENAFEAHYKLVTIHPFQDGNGRTSRLVMNLQLVRGGYCPVAVRPKDRMEYVNSLEDAQLNGNKTRFQTFMHQRLLETMESYLSIIREATTNLAKREIESKPEDDRRKPTAAQIARMRADRGIT